MAAGDDALIQLLGGAQTGSTNGLDLSTFQKSIASTDPWRIAQGGVNSFNPNTSTWSPTETGVASFAKAFLSGILGGQAQNSEADQLNKVISVLPQLYKDPSSVQAPEGVDQSPFDVLKGSAILKNYTTGVTQTEKDKTSTADTTRALLGKLVDSGQIGAKDALGIAMSSDPASALAAFGITNGPSDKMQAAFKAYGIDDPDAQAAITNMTDLKEYVANKINLDAKTQAAQDKQDAKDTAKQTLASAALEKDLRHAIQLKDNAFNVAQAVLPQFQSAQDNLAQNSLAGDLQAYDAANKIVSPNGIIRRGIIDIIKEDAQSPLQSSLGDIQSLLGGSKFTPEGRQKFLEALAQTVKDKVHSGLLEADSKRATALRGKANPDQVIDPDLYSNLASTFSELKNFGSSSANSNIITAPDGTIIQLTD